MHCVRTEDPVVLLTLPAPCTHPANFASVQGKGESLAKFAGIADVAGQPRGRYTLWVQSSRGGHVEIYFYFIFIFLFFYLRAIGAVYCAVGSSSCWFVLVVSTPAGVLTQ